MSILIKGMEIPESCYYCPFADGVWQKNKRCLINGEEMPRDGRNVQQNHLTCPLIEVPPHGELIDADALLKLLDSCMFPSDMVTTRALSMATNWLKKAPTVIPAEKKDVKDV